MNNLMQIIQLIRSGGNPEAMLRNMAQQNPVISQALKIVEGKNPEQVRQIAANMAKERGIDIGQLTQQIHQMIGF